MLRGLIACLVTLSLIAPAIAADDAQVVWQIGKVDKDYRDLTYFGDLGQFGKTFPPACQFHGRQERPAQGLLRSSIPDRRMPGPDQE